MKDISDNAPAAEGSDREVSKPEGRSSGSRRIELPARPEFIKPFDGTGDVSVWLKKIDLVARLHGIDSVVALIPLYLEGTAFTVYDQLEDHMKDDEAAIKKALRDAFGQNKFSAYDSLRQRSWTPGEPVDAYLADLRRLAALAEIESDELIRCAFVCGLPADVSSQLRAGVRILDADLHTIVEQARVLMDERTQGAFAAARPRDIQRTTERNYVKPRGRPTCSRCGGDHQFRFCKLKSVVCWCCDQVGHIARNCPSEAKHLGNGSGKLPAPAASPET